MCIWQGNGAEKIITVKKEQPLIAYKELTFSPLGILRSPTWSTRWVKSHLTSTNSIRVSSKDSAGIYSYKTEQGSERQVKYERTLCYARVEIWGKVAVHTTDYLLYGPLSSGRSGYRSEHCRIVELFMKPRDWEEYAQKIADRYDITVTEI